MPGIYLIFPKETQPTMRYDVYGRELIVERRLGEWVVFHTASEGKRRRADGVVIPPTVAEEEIGDYLADLLHEFATESHPEVRRVG